MVFTALEALVADAPLVEELLVDEPADAPEPPESLVPELQAARVSIEAAKVVAIHHRLRIAYLHSHKLRF
ncbi:MAG TPA: hypothetical protein VHY58_04800 [Streptosporangiaceae bacterium]|jgi:hypothetical protein|nr:hypothetical protein [Streptosporangiaceae bacterium]